MSWLGIDKVWDVATDIAHAVTGIPTAQQVRAQNTLVNDQIKAYREQTEITKGELARVKGEEDAQKRRIEEKQIRSLRRNYRVGSLLTAGQEGGNEDMTSKLGG